MSTYHHLSEAERAHIECSLKAGESISIIAQALGRHRSTISREIRRNGHVVHRYVAELATRKVKKRRSARPVRLQRSDALLFYVVAKLDIGWTPEEISKRMREDKEPFYVCHETIYQYLYSPAAREDKLHLLLVSKRYARRYRHARKPQESRIPKGQSVHNRGKIIDNRCRYGDWEADLVMGKKGTGNVTTLVERKSRLAIAIKNPSKHTHIVISAIHEKVKNLPTSLRRSMTFDQGTEFADHDTLPCKTFFCDPHSPWQKGANENFNGRLRRSLPKGSSFKNLSQSDLDSIIFTMNNTPRKCLNWKTPQEVFNA